MSREIPSFMQPQYFLPFFIAVWLGMTGLLAHLGGWARLARRYKSESSIEGDRFWFVSGAVGHRIFPVNYGNCLFVTAARDGVRISILFPFRFQSPPLYLPWSDVESVVQMRFLFLFSRTTVTVRDL